MKTDKKLSLSIIKRIVLMIILLICLLTLGVVGSNLNINCIKIVFDDSEITVMTSKTKVSEILEENKIIVLDDEFVCPDIDSEIDVTKTITISKTEKQTVIVSEEVEKMTTNQILGAYVTVTEKIIVEQEEIPFETITKDVSNSDTETTDRVVQEGQNGLKNVTYKVRYQNEEEIDRAFISEEIVKEPVDKIIQIYSKVTNRSSARDTQIVATSAAIANSVAGKEPTVVQMNVSAYTASTCGKNPYDPGYGITSSGVAATAWCTLAAGAGYPIGTVIYIPYFASQPNGGWFVVQDRGRINIKHKIRCLYEYIPRMCKFWKKNFRMLCILEYIEKEPDGSFCVYVLNILFI